MRTGRVYTSQRPQRPVWRRHRRPSARCCSGQHCGHGGRGVSRVCRGTSSPTEVWRSSTAPGLHVYADQPTLQVGPLALLVAGGLDLLLSVPAKEVALGLMTLVGPTIVIILAPLVRGGRASTPGWWRAPRCSSPRGRFSPCVGVDLDDVLAMLAAVVAVRAVWANRPAAAGLALAAALAAKPWAVGFLPILLGLSSGAARAADDRSRRWHGSVAALLHRRAGNR